MKQKDLLYIVISLFSLVVIYIVFTIYNNAVTSTIPSALSIQIEPIAPAFDTNTIEKLKHRERVNPSLQNQSPTPTPSVSLTPTPTIQPTPTEVASQSSQISL